MLSPQQQAQAEKRLKVLAEEQDNQKNIKNKIKNVTKTINQKLKSLSEGDAKKGCQTLSKMNEQYLAKFLTDLENRNRQLLDSEEKLKNEKELLNRQKINALDDKERLTKSISQIKDTILKINKAISDSVKEQTEKRQKIEQDLDKSIAQIKQKITLFQKQSKQIEQQNVTLREKKQGFLKKMSGLQQQFKAKAEQKDESVKKQKEDLMGNLKEIQNQVNEATELSKKYGAIQKKNFDNKLSIYLRVKKFPQICNSMQSSANTINKCKEQLTKGVQRLLKAMQITKNCQEECKKINEQCISKLKIKSEKQQNLLKIKAEKEKIKQNIIELQNKKKEKNATAANQ